LAARERNLANSERVAAEACRREQPRGAEQDIVVRSRQLAPGPGLRGEGSGRLTRRPPPGANTRYLSESTNGSRCARHCLLRLKGASPDRVRPDLIEGRISQGVLDWLEVHELHEVVSRGATGPPVRRTTSPSQVNGHRVVGRRDCSRCGRTGGERTVGTGSSVPSRSGQTR